MENNGDKTKLFVLTQGEYSDYKILGVYSTLELANRAAKLFVGDFCSIEEFDLDFLPQLPGGMHVYRIGMKKTGDVKFIDVYEPDVDLGYWWEPDEPILSITRGDYYYTHGEYVTYINCRARDKEHAIKIANDLRAHLIATNMWDVDHDYWRDHIKPQMEYIKDGIKLPERIIHEPSQ